MWSGYAPGQGHGVRLQPRSLLSRKTLGFRLFYLEFTFLDLSGRAASLSKTLPEGGPSSHTLWGPSCPTRQCVCCSCSQEIPGCWSGRQGATMDPWPGWSWVRHTGHHGLTSHTDLNSIDTCSRPPLGVMGVNGFRGGCLYLRTTWTPQQLG